MFSFGMSELLIIMLVILLLFGPDKIPGLARTLGKALNEMRRAAEEVKQELTLDDIDEPGPKKK